MSPTGRKGRSPPEGAGRLAAAQAQAEAVAAVQRAQAKLGSDPVIQAFEAHLLETWGEEGKRVKRVLMPTKPALPVKLVWLRSMDSDDEIEAATMADLLASPVQKQSNATMTRIERREARRLTICGWWLTGAAGPVDVDHAVPLVEINKWPPQFWAALEIHFLDLNGLPSEELQNSIVGSVILGAPMPTPSSKEEAAAAPRSAG